MLRGKDNSGEPSTINGAPITFEKANRNAPLLRTENPVRYGDVPMMVALLDAKIVSEE